jgi:hypothetical protein
MIKFFILACLALSHICLSEESFINEIPDFTQTDIRGKNTGNGKQYCAPVAVSNSLVWLNNSKSRQVDLIHKLASKPYMNTNILNGTGASGVLRGVAKISKELFGGYEELEYAGWRQHPKQFSKDVKVPDINKIKKYLSKKSAVWINVGWYKYDKKKDEYERIGGHWVTLVGAKDDQLILHDPGSRSGKEFSNEFAKYTIINKGKLTGKKTGLPISAKDYISLGEGMPRKSSADFTIIDGVIYFKIK